MQQIAAPDIVLQLVPVWAISVFRELAQSPNLPVSWLPSLCPALGTVIYSHTANNSTLPPELCALVAWLADRADDVYRCLAQYNAAPAESSIAREAWQRTGTYYGLPAIRKRCVREAVL